MTPRRAAPTPWGRADLVLLVVLYAATAAWFLWLAAGASAQGVITGEEASVSHRDAMALAVRWQPSIWSTNAAGQLFYWAAGHLDPDYGLLYARTWKAVASALLAPLLYVTAQRRLGCGRASAVLAGVVGVALPAVSLLAWVGIETPLDVVAGLAALLLVTSRTRWWWLGLVMAGVAVSLYTAALASAGAVVVVALVRAVRAPLGFLAGAAGGALVVVTPLWWWRNGGIVVTGGGRAGPEPAAAGEHLRELGGYALDSGSSYYWFADLPALGAPWIAAVLVVGALVGIAARVGQLWPWLLAGVLAVALYAVASGVPGTRRVLLVAVVLALAAAVGVDVVASAGRWTAAAVVPLVVLAVLVTPLVTAMVGWRGEVAAGRPALPIDWPFPVDPGGDQASTLARLADGLRAGRTTPREVGDGWGGTRTLAMIFMLDERAGRAPALGPGDVLAYYRVSEDCPPLDGPACGVSASRAPGPGG
ncbi:hypothetical protein GCM10023200_59760 [Actinomycetospora chlora]|uniref:Glycosyltransferase RgtA/B/C/D-like domain-containing protein n=1 Tax=Actinomycetospora chlora TaxID=663608 RepID=A0ABP9CLZ9_9PSEU